MRKPMIAGNWKLHKTQTEARALAAELSAELAGFDSVEVVIAPPFTALDAVAGEIDGSCIQLAAQNCYPATTGAFTGEVSPVLLKDAGCRYVIVGHSERRQLLGESDEFINRKVHALLEAGVGVIFCIGETLEEREADQTFEVLRRQVRFGLKGVSAAAMAEVVVAYEPVWAIGTGKTASDEQAQEAHAFIRALLRELFNAETAGAVRILYGGSVKPSNVDGLMAQPDVDGALVGGASLQSGDFVRIARFRSA